MVDEHHFMFPVRSRYDASEGRTERADSMVE
jgi:hypothetical protein